MEIYDFLKNFHNESITYSDRITFDKKHPRHLHQVALYGSLIELSGCIITLIDKSHRIGVAPIFRSFLEAYVELSNLNNKAKYGYYMDSSYHSQWLKVLKEAKNNSNPFLEGISKVGNLDDQIQVHEIALKELSDKGYKPLTIYEKFERAGMVKEYRSLYNFLCSDSHSNIRALIGRHLEVHEDDFTVVYYKDEPLKNFLSPIDSTAGLLVSASLMIHRYFDTNAIEIIQNLNVELIEIRSRY